jgi:X-Pro dipeptidyl-peptidase
LATTIKTPTELSFTDDASLKAIELLSPKKEANRLLFWNNLDKPMHLSGTGRIHIQVASNKAAANLSVYLIAVPQDAQLKKLKIEDIIVNRAWADPQNHVALNESAALEPGKFYDLTFNFQPDDQIIPAGHKLGLLIFSSDPEFTLKPKKGTQLTVNLTETWIELMVVD